MNENKQLYKSKDGAVIGGVCKGIAEVYNYDVALVRIIAAVLFLVAGFPIIIYIILYFVFPNKEDVLTFQDPKNDYNLNEDEYSVNDDDYYY